VVDVPLPPADPPKTASSIARLRLDLSEVDRLQLREELKAQAPSAAKSDLVWAAVLLLSRDAREWGLVRDIVAVKVGDYEPQYEGALMRRDDRHVTLRLGDGTVMEATRGGERWTVYVAGALKFTDASVTVTASAPGRSRGAFDAVWNALPPEKWMSAGSADHLDAAKAAVKAGVDGIARVIGAAHAMAVIEMSKERAPFAKAALQTLGLIEVGVNRWQPSEEVALDRAGRALRQNAGVQDAIADLRLESGFRARYAAAALRLNLGSTTRDQVREVIDLLMRAQGGSPSESANVKALLDGFANSKVCSKCDGVGQLKCTTCQGKGRRAMSCGQCGGHGFIITVGQGGGKKTCPSCRGNALSEACKACAGRGRVDCGGCAGAWRAPMANEVRTLRPCAMCAASGSIGGKILHACPACAGLGMQLVPMKNPDAVLK